MIIHEEMNNLVAEVGEHWILGKQSRLGQPGGGSPSEVLHGEPNIPPSSLLHSDQALYK